MDDRWFLIVRDRDRVSKYLRTKVGSGKEFLAFGFGG